MNNELFWVWLSAGLGPSVECLDLLSAYEWNPYNIYCASPQEIFSFNGGLTRKKVEKLKNFPLEKAEEFLRISNENGWKIITPSSEYYPPRLLGLSNLPLVLYVDGNPEAICREMSLSVVGARKASDYGRAVARAIASCLAEIEFTVVSGGALGVDSAAHLGALDVGGETVCVMGCGLGTNYLAENEELRRKIRRKGAVISEFPPFSPASRITFPLRNRIISGMSLGTIVVEAGEKSGSLITAGLAAEQGRNVFAVPGDLVTSSYLGTNNLIRNGAVPVFSPNDILSEYEHLYFDSLHAEKRFPDDEIIRRAQRYLLGEAGCEKTDKKQSAKRPLPEGTTKNAAAVYNLMGDEAHHVDDIKEQSGLSVNETLSAFTELELYGLVVRLDGRRYKIKPL